MYIAVSKKYVSRTQIILDI